MPAASLEVLGTVRPDGTLELDEKLSVAPGRVRVRVELVQPAAPPSETMIEFLDRTRRELEAAGHKFMNDDDLVAWLAEQREDDDRIKEICRQAQEEGPPQGPAR